uniref:Lipocalin-2 1 n=1 Tax=Amblyomma cajennense TaxID=34607 RepID=A0A023FTU5_AMBCJ
MNSFTIAVFLALGVTALGYTPSVDDLYKALNTTGRIWTVLRSYKRFTGTKEHTCVSVENPILTKTSYEFDQYYKVDGTRIRHHLYGEFTRGAYGPVLTVRNETGRQGIPYTLRYWNEDKHCGFLTFPNIENGEYECELHVWEQELVRDDANPRNFPCEDKYQDFCGHGRKHIVYARDCLN